MQNESLLLKHLHKFYNKAQVPWVQLVWDKYYSRNRLPVHSVNFKGSFWWRDILKLLSLFKDLAPVQVKDGKSCLLWSDSWVTQICSQAYPELFSFAKCHSTTVHMAVTNAQLHDLFHLPLSQEAFGQFQTLSDRLQSLNLQNTHDHWKYTWGSYSFTSSKAYEHLIGHRTLPPAFSWPWRSSCQNKRKFFFWLILQEQLNTRGLLRRKHTHLPRYSCVFCSLNAEEDLLHMLFHCPFSSACWNSIQLQIPSSNDIMVIVEVSKLSLTFLSSWKSLSQCVGRSGLCAMI